MPKEEGNAHGRHYTDEERAEDENRNHNQSHGRDHFAEDEHEKAGGHSDRWADDDKGEQHEFRRGEDNDNVDAHNKPQDEGRMQGEARSEGGHQGGRNRKNSR